MSDFCIRFLDEKGAPIKTLPSVINNHENKSYILGYCNPTIFADIRKAIAQIGEPYIHDPSTIMECEGKYYTFGTGGGGLISEDGWTWNGGGVRPGRGAAPDAVK